MIWPTSPRPYLLLAPMAGYTDSPFRRMVKSLEPSTILVSELTSVEALKRGNEKTLKMIAFTKAEKHYYGVQLFGKNEESFAQSVAAIEALDADFIDINFGCPAPKVIGSGYGSALLRDPDIAARIIEKLKKSTKLPVTVKMRLGFENDEKTVEMAQRFEQAGADAITIHGRTTKQKFSGISAWEKIYEVKAKLKIPVIGNGDILSAEMAREKLKNLDGVMIGRAAIRNPWIFRETRALLEGREMPPKPSLGEQIDFFLQEALYSIELKGEKWAILELRKHFCHFVRGVPQAAEFRERLMRVEKFEAMQKIFSEIQEIENF